MTKSSKSNIISNKNIETILRKKIIAEIPDDGNISSALKSNQPLIYSFPDSSASIEFKKLAARLIGGTYPETTNKSLFSMLFKKLGLN